MYKKYIFFVCCLITIIIMSGCMGDTQDKVQNTDEKLQIITSFYPIAYIVSRVAGDRADVINLTGATDVHEYQVSPHDIISLHEADSVFIFGASLESWAHDITEQLHVRDIPVIAMAEHLTLYGTADQVAIQTSLDADEHHEAVDHHIYTKSDEHAHTSAEHTLDGHTETHEVSHAHGTVDPHAWLDPIMMQEIVHIVRDTLISLDPASADLYRIQADSIYDELAQLDRAYQDGISDCVHDGAIVSHDAFGYLERRYGFTLYPIAGISTLDEPSAHTLAQIKDVAYNEGVTHILIENNAIKRFAETIADETQLRTLSIDPIAQHVISDDADYFSIAYDNLAVFRTALACQ